MSAESWQMAGWLLSLLLVMVGTGTVAHAAREDLGNGFLHHGIATPASNARGMVATVDGNGRDVMLVWLFDHRGGYALLVIDAETGESHEYATPFPPGGDCPYASLLSSRNRYYTHFNSHFVEFDPVQRKFTFFAKTTPQMAMSMTEDDQGLIWAATYPGCGLLSYNPQTGELKDYGSVHQENWAQYPRSLAADDKGYIYFGIGYTLGQIFAFDPATGRATPIGAAEERGHGMGMVYRDVNGKVYGTPTSGEGAHWYELYEGKATKLAAAPAVRAKPIIAGDQGLFHNVFPDGKRVVRCDTVERVLEVEDPKTGTRKAVRFEYSSEGAHIMGVAAAPNGTICGGTAFPFRFFSYDPRKDEWINREAYGQWNTVARQGDRFFVGGYSGGFLLEWDPAREWVPTVKGKEGCNPQFLADAYPDINRPHELLAHPDGHTLVLAGTPGYGYTGGGLLFWDRQTRQATLLKHQDLLPEHSTMSLVALPDGKLLGGTTTSPGTGGEKKAAQAELYLLDMATKKVEWHAPVLPGAQNYLDMILTAKGLVYGIADRTRFFVFDPARREVVYQSDTSATLGPTVVHQGSRIFVAGSEGEVYILFAKGIARVDPDTFEITLLASSPVPIEAGGDLLEGRIYFASGSHLYSWAVPTGAAQR
jgi:outer membrane protein assembly factor BamB